MAQVEMKYMYINIGANNGSGSLLTPASVNLCFFKEIYCTESIYSVYKDKLQNCSLKQFEYAFTP